jgi:hypothetical protein
MEGVNTSNHAIQNPSLLVTEPRTRDFLLRVNSMVFVGPSTVTCFEVKKQRSRSGKLLPAFASTVIIACGPCRDPSTGRGGYESSGHARTHAHT